MSSGKAQLRLLGGIDLTQTDGTQARAVLAQPKRLALLFYLASQFPGGFTAGTPCSLFSGLNRRRIERAVPSTPPFTS
jgi:hypothetical protein